MLTGKYISLKNIIAKVYRDFGLKEEDDFVNFIEWGAEALEQIGTFEQLQTKSECLDINFYKACLPVDLVYINQIQHDGRTLNQNANFFGPLHETINVSTDDTGLSINEDRIKNRVYVGPDYITPLQNTYKIDNGYLKVGFETGKIDISYQALLLDCDGFPLVPDEVSFREAVYRYIVYKYLYPLVIKGQVPMQLYLDAEQKWHWYCGQAGAKAQMPDLAKLESIKRNYLRLKPDLYRFDKFFEEINGSK